MMNGKIPAKPGITQAVAVIINQNKWILGEHFND